MTDERWTEESGIEARRGQPRVWPERLRWFAAEFLVVVSGVLVALALNAFYQGRVDAEREAGYLRQLDADLTESASALEEALAANRAGKERVLDLLALFGTQEIPSEAEFRDFRTLSISPAQPTLSTAQAVVETGDLHLIRDDSVRSGIVQYVGAGESYGETQDAIAWEWLTPLIRDYYEIVRPGAGPAHPFATSPGEALADESLYDIAFDLQLGYSNHIRAQEKMLIDVRRLQEQVARVIGSS
ncbi:MAG: hypothetical protein GVY32_05405 [Gammaproteobacteria bacterium]|jgi:hypothetical protein|nr:hypothetical protein [Gammaproteobacteria bacterium]